MVGKGTSHVCSLYVLIRVVSPIEKTGLKRSADIRRSCYYRMRPDRGRHEDVMAGKAELKRAVCGAIHRKGNENIELGERILHHPETGFNEDKTAALVAERMRILDLAPQTGLALTGVK